MLPTFGFLLVSHLRCLVLVVMGVLEILLRLEIWPGYINTGKCKYCLISQFCKVKLELTYIYLLKTIIKILNTIVNCKIFGLEFHMFVSSKIICWNSSILKRKQRRERRKLLQVTNKRCDFYFFIFKVKM